MPEFGGGNIRKPVSSLQRGHSKGFWGPKGLDFMQNCAGKTARSLKEVPKLKCRKLKRK